MGIASLDGNEGTTMKKVGLLLGFWLMTTACPGGDTGQANVDDGQGPVSAETATAGHLVFEATSFSPFVEKTADGKTLRIAYSFFPDGTDFDFDAKTVSIPCSFKSRAPDGVDLNLSAPVNQPCNPYKLSFNAEGEAFTLNGIEVPLTGDSYTRFVEDFEFEMTTEGIRDSLDGSSIETDGGKLEDYYFVILAQ